MTILKPQVPFIWPDLQVFEEPSIYENYPPFGNLVLNATWLFGVVPALTERGVRVFDDWLEANSALKISIIVVVYPACSVRQSDLDDLRALAGRYPDRLNARILPLEQVTDRSINALCFSVKDSDPVHMVIGPTEDLGLDPWRNGHLNFAFHANPSLVEAFRRQYDCLWDIAGDLLLPGATYIPELALPTGSEEAASAWRAYQNELRSAEVDAGGPDGDTQASFESKDVVHVSPEGEATESPTAGLGIRALDSLTEFVIGLYGKGQLVSVDKLTRIPPLDVPLDPSLFGDSPELRSGNVIRKVNMRVSVIDEKTLKEIDKCRQAQRTLLTRFTFGLADNTRWMPNTARSIFEAELKQANDEGLKLIKDLLKDDVDAFLAAKREELLTNLNGIYAQLGRPGQIAPYTIEKVVASLKVRLTKAQSSNFMPKLSYSSIGFTITESAFASPWGQAYSLLSDIAAFPRKAHTNSFFFRGFKTPRRDLLAAMDVAGDTLVREPITWETEERCKREIDLLSRIEDARIEPKDRCSLVWKIIQGAETSSVEQELEELRRKRREEEAD